MNLKLKEERKKERKKERKLYVTFRENKEEVELYKSV